MAEGARCCADEAEEPRFCKTCSISNRMHAGLVCKIPSHVEHIKRVRIDPRSRVLN